MHNDNYMIMKKLVLHLPPSLAFLALKSHYIALALQAERESEK